jgi:hypothetical protein
MWSEVNIGAVSVAERANARRPPALRLPTPRFGARKRPTRLASDKRFPRFLTGSGMQTEIDVTCSKQSTREFLTGARMHINKSIPIRDAEILWAKEKRNLSAINSAIIVVLCL